MVRSWERTHQKEKEALPSDPYTGFLLFNFPVEFQCLIPLASPLAPAHTSVWIYDVASLSRQSEQQPHLQLAYWFDINTSSPLSLGASLTRSCSAVISNLPAANIPSRYISDSGPHFFLLQGMSFENSL